MPALDHALRAAFPSRKIHANGDDGHLRSSYRLAVKKAKPGKRMISVRLSMADLALVVDALDSHAYWQLSETEDCRDGYTFSRSPEVRRCARLETRLRRMTDKSLLQPGERRIAKPRVWTRSEIRLARDNGNEPGPDINPETGERWGGDINAAWDDIKHGLRRD